MSYPRRIVAAIIILFFASISQATVEGCTIEITLPLGVVGLFPRNFTQNIKIGEILKFHCISQDQITYTLDGAPKVLCEKDNTWSSKIPRCKATLCSPTLPTVPNAQLVTTVSPGQSNKIGGIVDYKCVKGYAGPAGYLAKVCQKDGYWQGNISCKRITCIPPVLQNGNVSYTSLVSGSIVEYQCNIDYVLTGPSHSTCDDNGLWSGNVVPHCSKLCRALINPKNGYFVPASSGIYRPGAKVTLKCVSRYIVRGSQTRHCLDTGEWTGIPSKCVVNSCGPPGPFSTGHMDYNREGYIIGTKVKFECFSGYKLNGPSSRQCRNTGQWSEVRNPTCVRVFCSEPGFILHGNHNHRGSEYPYGTKLVYTCDSPYYMWGETNTLECKAYKLAPYWSSSPPLCLTLIQFSSKCHEVSGHFHIKKGKPDCVQQATATTTANVQNSANRHSMDTLTIVTASAGSTLGVLVIVLSIMVFVRRFHRNRRFRHHSIRSRFYSDDDHVTLIACPRGFHFPLPSYDEAMSQVHRDPPPFETVVQTNGTTTVNNNNTSNTTPLDPGTHDRTVLEVSADQQINIVNNPLTVTSQQRSESESNPGAIPRENSNRNSISSQDSLVISESPSSHDGTTLSLSEDEQSVNESQPLIGSN